MLVALDFGVEGWGVFAFDELIGVVVGGQAGDAAIDDGFVGYGLAELAAVAVGLGFAVIFLLLHFIGGFWGVVFHGDLILLGEFAGHLLKLFDAGKLAEVFEAEAEEEFLGGFVEDGAADDLFAAGGGDELAGEEGAEDAAGVDAADLGDLGGGDGLFVGDDGEGFEGLEGELEGWLEGFDEAADGVVVLGLGGETVAAGDFADLEAAVGGGVVGDELVEEGAEVVAETAGALLFLFGSVADFLASAGASLPCWGSVAGSFRGSAIGSVIGSSRVSLVRMAAVSASACWWRALRWAASSAAAMCRARSSAAACSASAAAASSGAAPESVSARDCWAESRWSSSAWASWPRRPSDLG